METTLQHWHVTGLQQQGAVPSLIASAAEDSSSLLRVVFERNPQDSSADQMLRVSSQPVEIIYDSVTRIKRLLGRAPQPAAHVRFVFYS